MKRFLVPAPVDDHAWCSLNTSQRNVCKTSPLADQEVDEVTRPEPLQTVEQDPPRSAAREVAYATLLSRVLSVGEAVRAVRLR